MTTRPRMHESCPSWMQHARDLGDYDISPASYGGIEIEPIFEDPESMASHRVGEWVRSEDAGKRIEELVRMTERMALVLRDLQGKNFVTAVDGAAVDVVLEEFGILNEEDPSDD